MADIETKDVANLAELTRVTALRTLRQGDDVVPEGATGTIVHVYPRSEAYEVEFSAPVNAVVLARRDDLKRA